MSATTYTSTREMLAAHPGIMGAAIRFRLTKLFDLREARSDETLRLIGQWHALQGREAVVEERASRATRRTNSIHKKAMRAARRAEAARCSFTFGDLRASLGGLQC